MFESLRRWTRGDRSGLAQASTEWPVSVTVASMDEAGIAKSLICAWVGPKGALISNDEVAGFMREAPDRLVGVGSVHIARPREAVREIRRCVRISGSRRSVCCRGCGRCLPRMRGSTRSTTNAANSACRSARKWVTPAR